MSMSEFVTVGSAADLSEGEMRAFEVGGRRVTVANVGGSLHAFDDTCTHRQCSLAEGDLEEATVTCPCHGSQFDVATGVVLNPPATEPVRTYPVRVEGDDLQVGT
jgi:nitrite reductase/ring-hydroxylating ferredoxin subunit